MSGPGRLAGGGPVRGRAGAAPPAPAGAGHPPGGNEVIVHASRVTKRFGGIRAVDEVEFAVRAGELVGLIGPNGSGKTTLVNLLTGHLAPDAGEVFLQGRRVHGLPPYAFAASGVGRTFQLTQLFRRMTVLENMLVPGLTRPHSTRADATGRARAHLEFLGLARLEALPAKNLSGGQQKLLELGRALMLEPSILFLDEPFAGVHPDLRDEIIDRIRRLHEAGCTFVVVDHDMEAIQKLAERLVVMAIGRKIADGPPAAVCEDRAVLAAYAGF